VHFARFVIVGDNICMFPSMTGISPIIFRDFIATIGEVFNEVVKLVEDEKK